MGEALCTRAVALMDKPSRNDLLIACTRLSGTISGAEPGSEGSLIELWHNTRFLADGDEVVLRGRTATLELGEVRGRVIPPSYER